MTKRHKSVRIHSHEWHKTTRPQGFGNLNKQYQDYVGWQFQLSAKTGRVHGIMIDNTFYVIWLDVDHKLYEKKPN